MNSLNSNNFFDSFPDFYSTSMTGPSANRLNNRYRILIENNRNIIENSRILDLASHDGRWSFAALMNKANKVVGIEGKSHLVENAKKNMEKNGIEKERYSFIHGDILKKIKDLPSESVDIVFCFGIFYHIMHHMELLLEIQRLKPKFLIIDSHISTSQDPVIQLKLESVNEGSAINLIKSDKALVGWPGKTALDIMLNQIDFQPNYYDWHNQGITNWDDLGDYRDNWRVSLIAKNCN